MHQIYKRFFSFFVVAMMVLGLFCNAMALDVSKLSVTETPDVQLVIGGELKTYNPPVININGSAFLPLRALATDLGIPNDNAHIIWNQKDKSVTLKSSDGSREVYVRIDNQKGKVNGQDKELNAPPVLYKNSTYIPIRFVADGLGMKVVWDQEERRIYLKDQKEFDIIREFFKKSYIVDEKTTEKFNCKYSYAKETVGQKSGNRIEYFTADGNVKYDLKKKTFVDTVKTDDGTNTVNSVYTYDGKEVIIKDQKGTFKFNTKENESNYISDTFSYVGVETHPHGEIVMENDTFIMFKTKDGNYVVYSKPTGSTMEEHYQEKLGCILNLKDNGDNTITISGSDILIADYKDKKVLEMYQEHIMKKDTFQIISWKHNFKLEEQIDGLTVIRSFNETYEFSE